MRMAWGLVLVALLLLSGPGHGAATSLGVVAFQMSAATAGRATKAIEASGEDKGWDVTLADAQGSSANCAAQIRRLLGAGANALILVMVPLPELAGPLAEAAAKKVPVITVMSGASTNVLVDVAVNEYIVGAQMAVELLGLMRFSGSVAMVREPDRVATRIRGKVMDLALGETPGVKLVGSYDVRKEQGWSDDFARRLPALLPRDAAKPQALWAATDAAAFVADDALRALGYKKGQLLLTGIDGSQEAFRRIRDPDSLMTATIAIPYELLGESAADAMEDTLAGVPKEQIASGPYLFVDTVIVDRNNVPAEGEWPW